MREVPHEIKSMAQLRDEIDRLFGDGIRFQMADGRKLRLAATDNYDCNRYLIFEEVAE